MKKNTWFKLLSVVLILAIVGAVGYVAWTASQRDGKEDEDGVKIASSKADTATSAAPNETKYSETYKIGIIQTGLGNASTDCYNGFILELDERNLLGNLEIQYVIEDDQELCRTKIQAMVDGGCDLLYTIGRFASEEAAKITTEIPIVFGAVSSPEKVGLVESNQNPGGNVTGVSSYTPCFEQIDLIPMLLPSATQVAILYTGTDENAVSQAIAASAWAERSGLTCKEYIIDDNDSLKSALSKIKKAKTKAIYIPADRYLSKNIAAVVKFSHENKIPIFCGDEVILSQGAFATSEINYTSIGRKAAGMACDILFEKKDVSTFPVMYKHDCTNLVNKEVRDKLGIEIPATALGEIELWEPPSEEETTPKATAVTVQ